MIFECFAFHYSLFSQKEHHSFLSSLFISLISSRFISFVIPPKNMIHSMLPVFKSATVSLFSNTVHSTQKWLMYKASTFCAFKASRTCVFPSSCHFVQKDKNKLCVHDKIGNVTPEARNDI